MNCERLLTCEDVDCMNGGVCSDIGGVVTCNCSTGYTGLTCEAKGEYNPGYYKYMYILYEVAMYC